jgi:ribonuclease HIII
MNKLSQESARNRMNKMRHVETILHREEEEVRGAQGPLDIIIDMYKHRNCYAKTIKRVKSRILDYILREAISRKETN